MALIPEVLNPHPWTRCERGGPGVTPNFLTCWRPLCTPPPCSGSTAKELHRKEASSPRSPSASHIKSTKSRAYQALLNPSRRLDALVEQRVGLCVDEEAHLVKCGSKTPSSKQTGQRSAKTGPMSKTSVAPKRSGAHLGQRSTAGPPTWASLATNFWPWPG